MVDVGGQVGKTKSFLASPKEIMLSLGSPSYLLMNIVPSVLCPLMRQQIKPNPRIFSLTHTASAASIEETIFDQYKTSI